MKSDQYGHAAGGLDRHVGPYRSRVDRESVLSEVRPMGLFSKLLGRKNTEEQRAVSPVPAPTTPRPTYEVIRLAGDGFLGVVGESHYQSALRDAARGGVVRERDLGNAIEVMAVLIPELSNEYDANAVRVDVNGRTVGYLAREDAAQYQPALLELAAGGQHGTCVGRIMGGGSRNYGIFLHLSPPDHLVCANSPDGLTVLTPECHVTMTREELHQDALQRIAKDRQFVPVFASLAPCTIEKGKYAGAEGLEVRIDGERVGELTKSMSDRYAELVRAVMASGKVPGCEALINKTTNRGYQLEISMPRMGP